MTTPAILLLASPHTASLQADGEPVPWIARRETEVVELASRFARFRPTLVAVEAFPHDEDRIQQAYDDYRRGATALTHGEDQQIGFRVAAACGIDRIHGFDADWWLDDSGLARLYPGGDHLDFAFANVAEVAAEVHAPLDDMIARGASVVEVLGWVNALRFRELDHRAYLRIAELGDGNGPGGAEYVASWYLRNLRMYANLCRLAGPGVRIFAVVGSGHAKILRDLLEQGGRFEVVDPVAYLQQS